MPRNRAFGLRAKNSSPATTSDSTKTVSKEYPAIKGVTINNGMRHITAVENAVESGIMEVPKRERRSVLGMYSTAFRLARRGVVNLANQMEKEGEL